MKIVYNCVVAKLIDPPTKVVAEVADLLSYTMDGYEHTDAAQSRGWDGTISMYNYKTNTFPAGFVPYVRARLNKMGIRYTVAKKALPEPLGPMPTPKEPLVDDFEYDPRYYYQFDGINTLLKYGSMIARIATGGGKSRYARLCIKRIGRKTIFVTTRTQLMHQFARDCRKSGFNVSLIGDGHYDTSGDVICAMVQTLGQRLNDPYQEDETKEFLSSIEFLIAEEAHESSGNYYSDVVNNCRRAYYRLALTATPGMRDSASNMKLTGAFGPVRITITEKQLIDCGILAKPYFKYIDNEKVMGVRPTTPWQKALDVGIVKSVNRNKHIILEALRAAKYGLPVIVLVGRKNHGQLLKQLMQEAGLRVEFIYGDTDTETREKTLERLASGVLQVVIGTTIIDVGVDVPALSMIILAGGGKAEVALRQRIGRALREKKNGLPNVAFIVDFTDTYNKHLKKHAMTRRALVEAIDGFKDGILPKGADFDFEGLGFKKLSIYAE